MAITISDNLKIAAPKPARDTDVVGLGLPTSSYASKEAIPSYMRYLYMKVTDQNGKEWRLEDPNDLSIWTEIVTGGGNSETTKDITASVDAGGIAVGDVVPIGTDITELVDQLIAPLILPFIKAINRVTFNGVSNVVMEVGELFTGQASITYDRGLIESKNGSPDVPLTGASTGSTYSGTGINSSTGAISKAITHGSNLWFVSESFAQGTDPYYDSQGNVATNLDGDRGPGSVSDNSNTVTGRYRYWYSAGSAPTDSTGVRALSNKGFVPVSTFNISIPPNTPVVSFYLPLNSGTITVLYVESSNADVTGTFTEAAMVVEDAGGNGQQYTRFETLIGGGGYPSTATYKVIIN